MFALQSLFKMVFLRRPSMFAGKKPGCYEFFDEHNEKTARGALVVR